MPRLVDSVCFTNAVICGTSNTSNTGLIAESYSRTNTLCMSLAARFFVSTSEISYIQVSGTFCKSTVCESVISRCVDRLAGLDGSRTSLSGCTSGSSGSWTLLVMTLMQLFLDVIRLNRLPTDLPGPSIFCSFSMDVLCGLLSNDSTSCSLPGRFLLCWPTRLSRERMSNMLLFAV